MRRQHFTNLLGVVAVAMAVAIPLGGVRAVAQPYDTNPDPDVEVLTRGPVHEAFAEPGAYNPSQGLVVTKEPPPAIEEIPPSEKPEGDNVSWIPGYWSWDEDRDDFIWVSGIWRIPPPACSWVPGYWTRVAKGWTWTPGFWLAAQVDEVEYLPQPPASLEIGPSSPAPSPDYLWTPGCWVWVGGRYAWRPGYWVMARPEWIWVPAHIVWTPRGYVYVDGYWDWSLERRGVLFAPVYVPYHVYMRPHYVYCPAIVIHDSFLTVSLFIAPHHHHYFFGDYYDVRYNRRGYHPWFYYDRYHRGCDPIFVHTRWHHERRDPHWGDHQREDYDYRSKHADARPPKTYREQVADASLPPGLAKKVPVAAAPLTEVIKKPESSIRFEKIDSDRRVALGGQAKDLDKYRDERAGWESKKEAPVKIKPVKPVPVDTQEPKKPSFERPKRPETVEQPSIQPKTSDDNQEKPVARIPRDRTRPSIELPAEPDTSRQPRTQPKESPDVRQLPKATPRFEKPSKPLESKTPEKVKIPRSPVFGLTPGTSDKADNPPARPDMPKVDQGGRVRNFGRDSSAPGSSRAPASPLDSVGQGRTDPKGQGRSDDKGLGRSDRGLDNRGTLGESGTPGSTSREK